MADQPLQNWGAVVARAREHGPRRVVVAAAQDADVIRAAAECEALGLAEFILIGDRGKIETISREEGYRLDSDRVIDERDPAAAARTAARMAGAGDADIIMKGKVNTADLIRSILDREVGLRTGRLISGTIVMEVPGVERLMVLSDASINIAPTLTQKAELIENAVATARAVGILEPKVAVLTAFEFVNADMPATVDAACLSLMARRGQIQGAIVEGPIALDVAVSAWAAERKGFQSPVTGQADVFVCPTIEAANIMLRAIIYFAHGKVGGILQGAKVPIVLLSRAEPAETKVNSVALAVLAGAAPGSSR
jgi:phosphate butyryltransferase